MLTNNATIAYYLCQSMLATVRFNHGNGNCSVLYGISHTIISITHNLYNEFVTFLKDLLRSLSF